MYEYAFWYEILPIMKIFLSEKEKVPNFAGRVLYLRKHGKKLQKR